MMGFTALSVNCRKSNIQQWQGRNGKGRWEPQSILTLVQTDRTQFSQTGITLSSRNCTASRLSNKSNAEILGIWCKSSDDWTLPLVTNHHRGEKSNNDINYNSAQIQCCQTATNFQQTIFLCLLAEFSPVVEKGKSELTDTRASSQKHAKIVGGEK